MKFEKTLYLSKEEVKRLQNLLDFEKVDFEKENIEEDAVIHSLSARFNNCYSAEINVCSGQQNLWVDSVLFNAERQQIAVAEPAFDILGETFFEHDGNEYTVNIETEK